MRTIILFAVVTTLLISCTKYQYYNLSNADLIKDEQQRFILETDSSRITYGFHDRSGRIKITVYNKMNVPMQIDWKRSSMIVGDTLTSFFDPSVKLTAEIDNSRHTVYRDVYGTLSPPEAIDFIPPRSSVAKENLFVQKRWQKINHVEPVEEKTNTKYSRQTIRHYQFSKSTSPMVFRIYLTLITDKSSTIAIDQEFFVDEITEARASPAIFDNTGQDYQFYIQGKTGYGKASAAIISVSLLVLLIAAM